jgi:lysophospholipase L1-like esterase
MRSAAIFTFSAIFQLIAVLGCSKALPSFQDGPLPFTDTGRSFLALGDSYTIGQSVSAAERFPAQTLVLLRGRGILVKEPLYIARTGWTTADLKNAIASTNLVPPYDIVTLLIGVNDQYQGMDTAGYRTRFTQLLQNAVALAGNKNDHVFVLSIPDYGVTPFGGGLARTSKEIDDFNGINKQVALAFKITYVDITPISKMAAADQSYTAGDGLHPSAKQYHEWALKLSAAIF